MARALSSCKSLFVGRSKALLPCLCLLDPSSGSRSIHDISEVPRVQLRQKEPWKHRVHDYGYTFNYHRETDFLPRIKDCMQEVKMNTIERFPGKEAPWSKNEARFGQNDYIDLLGDGSVHPAQLLYHVPGWLRGFPGQHKATELVKLIHFRNIYKDRFKQHCPKRWHELVKHINYLMKYNNYKKQDEIKDERNLGLWDEEPGYSWKDKDRKSFLDQP